MIIVQNLVTGSKLLASTSTVQLNPTAGAAVIRRVYRE